MLCITSYAYGQVIMMHNLAVSTVFKSLLYRINGLTTTQLVVQQSDATCC
jgi:hypothetical protein